MLANIDFNGVKCQLSPSDFMSWSQLTYFTHYAFKEKAFRFIGQANVSCHWASLPICLTLTQWVVSPTRVMSPGVAWTSHVTLALTERFVFVLFKTFDCENTSRDLDNLHRWNPASGNVFRSSSDLHGFKVAMFLTRYWSLLKWGSQSTHGHEYHSLQMNCHKHFNGFAF